MWNGRKAIDRISSSDLHFDLTQQSSIRDPDDT